MTASISATGEVPAGDFVQLTAGLYRFMLAAEPALLSKKKAAADAYERLLESAQELYVEFRDTHESVQRFAESGEQLYAGLSDASSRAADHMRASLAETSANLRRLAAELDTDEMRERQDRLRELWHGLGRNYEALRVHAARMRKEAGSRVSLGHLKPRNLNRNLFHVSIGVMGVSLYELLFGRIELIWICASFLTLFAAMDIGRRVSKRVNELFVRGMFAKISRPGEAHKIPAATWYLLALLIGVWAFPQRGIELGTLILAFGDPVASLVGKRWGSRKIVGQKSWAGTLGFVGASVIVGTAFLTLVGPGMALLPALGIAAAASLVGAGAELLGARIEDNFTIPLAAGGAATLLLTLV